MPSGSTVGSAEQTPPVLPPLRRPRSQWVKTILDLWVMTPLTNLCLQKNIYITIRN